MPSLELKIPPLLLTAMALAVAASAWLGALITIRFCVYLTELQIKPEERFLLQQFGEEFRFYMARVRRWL